MKEEWSISDDEEVPELKEVLDAIYGERYRRAERMAGIAFLCSMCGFMLNHMPEDEDPERKQENVTKNFCRSLSAVGVTEAEAEEAMQLVDRVLGGSEDEFRWTPGGEENE